jgi:hypothetical protein
LAKPSLSLGAQLLERGDEGAEGRFLVRPDLQQVVQALLAPLPHVLEQPLTIAAARAQRGVAARGAVLGGRRDDEAEAEDGRQGDALEGGVHGLKGSKARFDGAMKPDRAAPAMSSPRPFWSVCCAIKSGALFPPQARQKRCRIEATAELLLRFAFCDCI